MPVSPTHVHSLTHRDIINESTVRQICQHIDNKLMTTTWLLDNIQHGSVHGDYISFEMHTGQYRVSDATCRAISQLYEKAGWFSAMVESDVPKQAVRVILYSGGLPLMQIPPVVQDPTQSAAPEVASDQPHAG